MTPEQKSVRDWMIAAEQDVLDRPAMPEESTAALRLKLIDEEFRELAIAIAERDLVAIADALGDIKVVTEGAACAFGIDLEPVFNEIMRSNYTKFVDGKVYRREDGKIKKGPGYQKPRLAPIVEAQQGAQAAISD